MMDWVGVFNAYADAGKARQNAGGSKDKLGIKRSSSARSECRRVATRPMPKSASAVFGTATKPATTTAMLSTSVLSRSSNENREGIYRYELSEPVLPMRPRRRVSFDKSAESQLRHSSTCSTSSGKSQEAEKKDCKEKNIFVQIKRNLINSLLTGIRKSPRHSSSEASPSPGSQSASICNEERRTTEDAMKLSQNSQDEFPITEGQVYADESEEIQICTCALDEDNEDSTGTMPRNSNHYVHPKFQLPPAGTLTNSQSRYSNTKCRIHSQSNGRKTEPLKGRNYNENRSNNNHLQNGTEDSKSKQQQQEENSPSPGPLLPPISQKKEFIPHFVLLDACKSVNERKIIELVKKLAPLPSDEVSPIANFQDQAGRTPLSYTCSAGNVMMVEELSKLRRLDPNLADSEGNTPLHYAAQAGHSEVVDLLLSRFNGVVELNCRNSIGLTPLMKAALQGRTRCTKSLISAGADPYLRDCTRQLTAEGWARLCGRHICAEVIVRSSKDYFHRHPKNPSDSNFMNYQNGNSRMPHSKSNMELKRQSSDESPYYHLYNARSTVSGVSWLKNKVKKALSGSTSSLNANADSSRPSPSTYALVTNLSNATICASSLLLPSIKPLLDDKQKQIPKPLRKMHIPSVQVTPVRR